MSDDRRNPYVLLGLPYGADLADAQRAFARRSREARWGDGDSVDVGDLTWALEQIESHHADQAAGYGTFRIPTRAGALEPPAGFGLLKPAPRPAPRQAEPSTDTERAAVFDAARLDASQQLLDRTAAAVGKRLEPLPEIALPDAAVSAPPLRRRGWAPIIAVAGAFVAVLAVAGVRSLLDDPADTADPVVTSTDAPATTAETTTTTDSTTTTSTDPPSASQTFGDAIELSGITITPTDPLDAFEHLCIVFTVEGDVPLGFVRSRVALIADGVVISPAVDIGTGRAEITDVYGDPSPATREICFPTADWQAHTTFLEYATDVGSYRWAISDPDVPAEGLSADDMPDNDMPENDLPENEWIEVDAGDTLWRFDVGFLQSNWTCIWGRGCHGILPERAGHLGHGCCSLGAELDGLDEARNVAALAATLPDRLFQFHAEAAEGGVFAQSDAPATATRVVDGACIFLNRPDHPHPGCALHLGALADGESPTDWKPSVCWQLPVKVDWEMRPDDVEVATVRGWQRRDWGDDGDTMAWLCTEGTEAYVGDRPVVESLADELIAMVGEPVFVRLRQRLAAEA